MYHQLNKKLQFADCIIVKITEERYFISTYDPYGIMGIFTPKVGGKRELSLAEDLAKEGKFEDAIEMAKQGLKAIRKLGNSQDIHYANGRILELQAEMNQEIGNLTNAIGAYAQAAKFYKQARTQTEASRMFKVHAELLTRQGQDLAEQKQFDSAAKAYETAAISLRELGREVDSLELKAKAFVFRAASVKDITDRQNFLLQAVRLFQDSGIDQPLVLGHLEYYNTMVERLSNNEKALESIQNAIRYYQEAGKQSLVNSAQALRQSILNAIAGT